MATGRKRFRWFPRPKFTLGAKIDTLVIVIVVFAVLIWAVHPTVPSTGAPGPRGRSGDNGGTGAPGSIGAAGSTGTDGFTALVVTTTESPGGNCAPGGQKVLSGLDNGDGGGTARDGIQQAGEVDYTAYVCNGAAGSAGINGYDTIVKLTTENPGANCAAGGKKVDSGLDNGDGGGTARNGVLEAGEVDATSYVCNGAAGAAGTNGYDTIVKLTTENPGANCAAGGKKVESGLDNGDGGGTARNGILEAGEVDVTTYVCNGTAGAAGTNGVDGFNSLVKTVSEAAGVNCAAGGWKVTSGLDDGLPSGTARNNVLEAGEVEATTYICSGTVKSLIQAVTEAQGTNCGISGGGYKLTSGMDNGDGGGTALDGILQAGEVDATTYVCFGGPGGGKIVYFAFQPGNTPTAATQWVNMPVAFTEFLGLTSSRQYVNLTAFTEARFSVGVQVASAANSFLLVQYSTAASNGSAWTNLAGATSPEVNVGSNGATKTTGWISFNASARADVLLRIMGQNGDGALDPTFDVIMCEFR